MAWDKGFDFRATSGYVTDPTDCTYVLAADTYPTTRNGVTFGWGSIGFLDSRDRNTTIPRLAGMHFTAATFQVDLSATGDHDIYLAFGDADNAQRIKATVKDSTTAFITITNVDTGGANNFLDATGTNRTAAQWVADSARGGTKVTRTFGSSTLNLLIETPTSGNTTLAHLFISQVGGGASGAGPLINNGPLIGGTLIRGGRLIGRC